ncbi:hypothetical protein AAC387_Pa09g1663 [Persea americana]
MGKHMHRKHSSVPLDKGCPGWMLGVFQLFDFHQRFYVRKAVPDKKHEADGQDGGTKNPGAAGEGHDFIDGKVDSRLIEDRMLETSPTSKKSGKIRIKALIAEEMSREHEKKHRNRASPARLTRTESIHHLGQTDYEPDENSTVCENSTMELHSHEMSACNSRNHDPVFPKYTEGKIISNERCDICGTMNGGPMDDLDPNKLEERLNQAKETFLKLKLMNDKGLGRDVQFHPSKEFLDALDVLNENRELFLKVLQDPNSILTKQGNSNPEAVLNKSGSFPTTDISGRRAASLLKLKQKQKEIQSYAKQKGKAQARKKTTGPSVIDSSEDGNSEFFSSKAVEVAEVGPSLESPPDSSHELINLKEKRLVRNRFKDIKKRIKHAIKESKKERLRISMDAILHRIPYGRKASKNAKSDTNSNDKDSQRSGYNSDSAPSINAKDASTRIRRTPSLTDSLDRYSQLLESVLRTDTKMNASEQPKFANEDGVVRDKQSSRTFQRILSLPEFGSNVLCRDADVEVPHDMIYRRTPSRILVDGIAVVGSNSPDNQKPVDNKKDTEKCTQLDSSVVENVSSSINEDEGRLVLDNDSDGISVGDRIDDDFEDLTMRENRDVPLHRQESRLVKNNSDKPSLTMTMSVLSSCIPDDIMISTEFSVPEASSEMEPGHKDLNELDHFANLNGHSGMDASDNLKSIGNIDDVQSLSIHAHPDSLHVKVDENDEAYFNYVRDVLKKSGFNGEELLGTWHSPDQPIDPSLFDEVECPPHKLGFLGTDSVSCDHQLLFDLINEVLLEIHERSVTYCPWNLCFNSNIRPIPMGFHVLEEVWASISWHLSSQPQLDPSLEYVVSRDLAKGDGWMHLRPEADCVGLELEDWIVDDLLDEVTSELASN